MKNNYYLKLGSLYTGSVLTAIAPIVTLVAFNWNDYVSTPQKSFSLAIGGVIALAITILQLLGKMPKNVHKLVKLGAITLFCWSLNALINELCILLSCAFGGELASWAIFTIPIEKVKSSNVNAIIDKRILEVQKPEGRV